MWAKMGQNGMTERFRGSYIATIDDRGLVITVDTDAVVFRSGSAELGLSGADILQLVGSALATVDNHVLVEGHTDNKGKADHNKDLSNRRAADAQGMFNNYSPSERARLLKGKTV